MSKLFQPQMEQKEKFSTKGGRMGSAKLRIAVRIKASAPYLRAYLHTHKTEVPLGVAVFYVLVVFSDSVIFDWFFGPVFESCSWTLFFNSALKNLVLESVL